MPYSAEHIERLRAMRDQVRRKYLTLVERYVLYNFSDTHAREHASHGFSRRLQLLARCIENGFTLIPPEQSAPPSAEQRNDAEINIQAFVLNLFGATDNLAWLWVLERGVVQADGSPLPNAAIGLRKTKVRQTFSENFRSYLDSRSVWFNYLDNYRDALVHRVPLYIPPYTVTDHNRSAYDDLTRRMNDAIFCRDFIEYDRLSNEQGQLASFQPIIMHSFQEGSPPVAFHGQLLADFLTIGEVGQKMLDQLNGA